MREIIGRGERWRIGAPGMLLAAALLAPSVFWVAKDSSIWSWDPAFYAEGSVDLWFTLSRSPARWVTAMVSLFAGKAPGIAWLGQFFVPLGRLVGSIEHGLLVSVLLAQFGALVLAFAIGKSMAPDSPWPAISGTVFVGAGPLFVAMSHHYLTEALQLLAVTYVYWVAAMAYARSWPPLRIFVHLLLATSVGLMAKISTPAYCLTASCLAAFQMMRGLARPRERFIVGWQDVVVGVAGIAMTSLGLAWYLHNWRTAFDFARYSGMAAEYGSVDSPFHKLIYWLTATRNSFLATQMSWLYVALALAVATLILFWRFPRERELMRWPTLLVWAALLQTAAFFAALSRSANEETRYLLALAPGLIVVVVWIISRVPNRFANASFLLLLLGQWAVVHGQQLGWIRGPAGWYWDAAPENRTALKKELARAVDRTCNERTTGREIMMGIEYDWLNLNTMSFYSAKSRLENGFRCHYVYLGHAQSDAEAGFKRLLDYRVAYFISVDARAMSRPPSLLNLVSLPVLERVEAYPEFVREPFDSDSNIVLFKHVEKTSPFDDVAAADRLKQVVASGPELTLEAEKFTRGNGAVDFVTFGRGIGVLVSGKTVPTYFEYDIVADASEYEIDIRYASAEERPISLFVNGKRITDRACEKSTGSWQPDTQTWRPAAIVTLHSGVNTIRLERVEGAMPHVDKLRLVPVKTSTQK